MRSKQSCAVQAFPQWNSFLPRRLRHGTSGSAQKTCPCRSKSTLSVRCGNASEGAASRILRLVFQWSPLRQEPEAPYNNETQASETKCTEACRSNYPAKQRITRPPACYTAFLPRLKPGDSKPRD